MQKQFLKEHCDTNSTRSAQVYKIQEGGFAVDCYENHEVVKSLILTRERLCHEQAQQWVISGITPDTDA